jgi:hypothetical protein
MKNFKFSFLLTGLLFTVSSTNAFAYVKWQDKVCSCLDTCNKGTSCKSVPSGGVPGVCGSGKLCLENGKVVGGSINPSTAIGTAYDLQTKTKTIVNFGDLSNTPSVPSPSAK